MVWLSLATSIVIVICARWLQRGQRAPIGRSTRNGGVAAGLMSYGSAWIAIWALTLAPIALVSALRETGVVFAVVIGVAILKERHSLSRLTSIPTTLIGTA